MKHLTFGDWLLVGGAFAVIAAAWIASVVVKNRLPKPPAGTTKTGGPMVP